ncbi:glucose-6-phosphate isomerase [Filifactor villosus]|uniref:Glucose-6-phosphate isomerase n=1 Tax=Filifactor villosus TaxID=29374 RepID=A0ABV9QI60_9FIRM
MKEISLDYRYTQGIIGDEEIEQMMVYAEMAETILEEGDGAGNDFLGWKNLPASYDREEFERIKKAAQKIQSNSDYLVTIGIGGSYLGAKAVIEALQNPYGEPKTKVLFSGNSISGTDLAQLVEFLKDKQWSINVISKSGTTTEPAISFRILKNELESKYGKEEARERIYVTTDARRGALKTLCDKEGYESFVIADNIGGRYSVLTAVGLLPIAVAGFDIDKLMEGAGSSMRDMREKQGKNNLCRLYAALRNILYNKGKHIEILVSYEPRLAYLSEWYKQLFGESEGKDGKGIFPASAVFSTDLHSMGQYIQDGKRVLFETVLRINEPSADIVLPEVEEDLDGLNYIAGKTVDEVNRIALEATATAHLSGGVPNIIIDVPKWDEYHLGYLLYFFERSCAISGYLLAVNPFDQPGVEEYKKTMFRMLGKPGY